MNTGDLRRIYFVHRYLKTDWADLTRSGPIPDASSLIARFKNGRDGWIIMTYTELARRGYPVVLTQEFVPGEVCVAHYDHIDPRDVPRDCYVVSVQADRDPTFTCEWQVVQSPAAIRSPTDYYIPYWPQADIVERRRARGAAIETIVYMGRERNLAARFRSRGFAEALSKVGVRLVIKGRESWNDYSDADLVLAARDGTARFLACKPASKLVNAWIAGVPALVGDEPAFRLLRNSSLDFMGVRTTEDVIRAISILREDPALYHAMVDNGRIRALDYTRDRIAEKWAHFLFDTVATSHARWIEGAGALTALWRAAKRQRRLLMRRIWGQRYGRGYDADGERISLARKLHLRLLRQNGKPREPV